MSSADAHSGSAASAPGVRLTVQQATFVPAPLKARQRKRKCPGDDASDLEDASADGEETDDAMGSAFRSKAPSDSESSAPSVDTDMDPDVETMSAAMIKRILVTHLPNPEQAKGIVDSCSEDDADTVGKAKSSGSTGSVAGAPGVPRHAPGTWKVWGGTWFYATKTPGFTDVKCLIKHPFRNHTTGMGTFLMSKALSPHHYGDDWDDPWRTMILLKSWAVWRARLHGWANKEECRLREVRRQMDKLVQELQKASGKSVAAPLLGSVAADALLRKWVPDVVRCMAP